MTDWITLTKLMKLAVSFGLNIKISPPNWDYPGVRFGGTGRSEFKDPVIISYSDLPYWPVSTVIGHQGRLVVGNLAGLPVLVMQGRAHYYEGYSMAQVTLPVRVMQRLGIKTMIVTNAAGGNQPGFPCLAM